MVDRSGGQTALHLAAQAGSGEFCRLLLNHGAELSIVDHDGCTAWDIAVLWQRLELASVFGQGAPAALDPEEARQRRQAWHGPHSDAHQCHARIMS